MSVIEQVFSVNRRLSRRLTPRHVHDTNVFGTYRKVGTLLLSHPDVSRVLDCAAGGTWHFPGYYKRWYGIHLTGVDIDAAAMAGNPALDEAVRCDVVEAIPVPPGSVDLVTAYSGLEHFRDNEAFLRNAFAALRPGGYLLAQFPGRYAPFAIVNRWLPQRAARALIGWSVREHADHLGFRAFYDRTNYSAFKGMAERVGFETTYHAPGYYSSTYAEFIFPLWVLSYAYDVLRFGLGIKNIASYNLFVLQKPDTAAVHPPEPFRL